MIWLLCNFYLSSWTSCGVDRSSSALVSETHASTDTHTHARTQTHTEETCWTCCTTCKHTLSLPPAADPQFPAATFVLFCLHWRMRLCSCSQNEVTLWLPLPSEPLQPLSCISHSAPQASGEFGGRSGIWSVGDAHFTPSWALRWPDRKLISSNKVRRTRCLSPNSQVLWWCH